MTTPAAYISVHPNAKVVIDVFSYMVDIPKLLRYRKFCRICYNIDESEMKDDKTRIK